MLPRRVAAVGGTQVHYQEAGAGAPVLFLHGVNCAGYWFDGTLQALSPHIRGVAPDLPGWGDTPPPPGFRYDVAETARFMLSVMDAVGLAQAAVVGWSFGGCIAMHMAAAAPDRVKRLVLVAPGGLAPEVHWSFRAMCLPGVGEWLMRPTRVNFNAGVAAQFHDPGRLPPEIADATLKSAHHPFFGQTTLRWLRRNRVLWEGAARICIGEKLEAIRCPTLVVWGADDGLVPPAHADIAGRIPGSRVVMLPNARHVPHVEVAEPFNALLAEFLAGMDA